MNGKVWQEMYYVLYAIEERRGEGETGRLGDWVVLSSI